MMKKLLCLSLIAMHFSGCSSTSTAPTPKKWPEEIKVSSNCQHLSGVYKDKAISKENSNARDSDSLYWIIGLYDDSATNYMEGKGIKVVLKIDDRGGLKATSFNANGDRFETLINSGGKISTSCQKGTMVINRRLSGHNEGNTYSYNDNLHITKTITGSLKLEEKREISERWLFIPSLRKENKLWLFGKYESNKTHNNPLNSTPKDGAN